MILSNRRTTLKTSHLFVARKSIFADAEGGGNLNWCLNILENQVQ